MFKSCHSNFTLVRILLFFSICTFSFVTLAQNCNEPNVEIAKTWWPPLKNVWTPIGWKDHFFRFNVIYNGTIVAQPHIERRHRKDTERWWKDNVQLTFTPSADGQISHAAHLQPISVTDTTKFVLPNVNERIGPHIVQEPYKLSDTPDGGVGIQGWTDNPTPVLWTEWPISKDFWSTTLGGVVLRQEVFCHIPGAKDVETGIEPLYAWIRLSVSEVDELNAPENFSFIVHIGNVNIGRHRMDNLVVFPALGPYRRELKGEKFTDGEKEGYRILEENGSVRLIALPAAKGTHAFLFEELCSLYEGMIYGSKDYYLRVTLPIKKGAHADLLLPMIPGLRKEIDKEMALGFEGALKESDKYWSQKPVTAGVIDTPESAVNNAIEQMVKFSGIIAEKNPHTGEYAYLLGSWYYDVLWASSCVSRSYSVFDNLGYCKQAEKYLELFRKNQGTVKPPGPAYKLHPGYFSTPKNLTAIDWLSDHGAILYAVCKHAMLSGDEEFIDRWLDSIIKGCEFIKYARALKDHRGVEGLLPPAVATDRVVVTQAIGSDAANYRGLTMAARLLKRIGHPRAQEFAAEARDYKKTFLKAYLEQVDNMPFWTDSAGQKHRLGPVSLSPGGDIYHHFYLDGGPLSLVEAGLMEANDPLIESMLKFFREGPNTKIYDPRGHFAQRPILIHEVSSAQIASGAVTCSWQTGDRYQYLEGMYSLLAAGMSDQTYIFCEHRDNIFGLIRPSVVEYLKLCVIDDSIKDDELHLLRLVPKAWLRNDYETRFEKIATEFGPVTIKFKLSKGGKALDIIYKPQFRYEPKKVVLHIPPIASLRKVVINGKAIKTKAGKSLNLK